MGRKPDTTAYQPTAEDVLESLNRNAEVLRAFGVTRIGLFGSFLHRSPTRRSDIDLLVAFDSVSFDRYMELKFFLEDLFGRKVDLVIEEDLKPALGYVREEAIYAETI